MPEQTPWKTREDFIRLKVGKRQIGKGLYGKVFVGKMWLKGKGPKSVAVKVFEPWAAEEFFEKPHMDDEDIGHYEEAISRLKRAGVPVLRTGFVKHNGQWVQVQELFAKKTGSKIADIRDVRPEDMGIEMANPNARKKF